MWAYVVSVVAALWAVFEPYIIPVFSGIIGAKVNAQMDKNAQLQTVVDQAKSFKQIKDYNASLSDDDSKRKLLDS